MANCIGWFFDVSIQSDQAVIWIKTAGNKILKLTDSYQPSFYILPRSETDGFENYITNGYPKAVGGLCRRRKIMKDCKHEDSEEIR